MDSTSFLIPIAIILLVAALLWRLKNSGQKEYSNTLLKVREKRKGSIYNEPPSTKDMLGKMSSEKQKAAEPAPAQDIPEPPEDLLELSLIDYSEYQSQSTTEKDFKSLRKPHPLLMSLSKSITDAQELINIVKSDPELVAMVLNMANSPFFGLRKAITDINHAVIYLGIAQVKNLATQFAISQSFEFETEQQQIAYDKIWKTSFLASAMALFVAREANLESPSELSTRCLLSYLGDIAFLSMEKSAANFYSDSMPLYMRIRGMQAAFNSNPAVMGGVFAQHLKLPKALHEGIGFGYQPLRDDWENTEATPEQKQSILFCYCLCRLAEYFILEADENYTKMPCFDYTKTPKPELYGLLEQLEQNGLGHLNPLLQSPRTKVKLSQMLGDLKKSV